MKCINRTHTRFNLSPLCSFVLCLMFMSTLHAQGIPDRIKQSIRQGVDNGYHASVIIGTIDASGCEYYAYGKTSLPDGNTPTEEVLFEIGSVTKVFTSLLLAEMTERGEVTLQDPISMYLPGEVNIPPETGRITLAQLATHTSGLPRIPDNMENLYEPNPYKHYAQEQMFEFLSTYRLKSQPGEKAEYSNLGMGLLGWLLARQSGLTYEQLLHERITDPLRLDDTLITLSPTIHGRLAKGYNMDVEVPPWDFQCLAGCGALRSSAQDMLSFLAANMGLKKTYLTTAMENTHAPDVDSPEQGMQMGLGWQVLMHDNRRIYWHNGMTGGYASFIGFDKSEQYGVVVLTNSQWIVDAIGLSFFMPEIPLGDYSAPLIHGTVVDVPLLPNEEHLTAQVVIERCIEATGGREVLSKVQNRQTQSTLTMAIAGLNLPGKQTKYQMRPNKYYVKVKVPGVLIVEQGYNDNIAWDLNSMTGPSILENKAITLVTDYSFDLTGYRDVIETMTLPSKALVDGRMCYKVILTTKEGDHPITYYIDTVTALLAKTEYTITQAGTPIAVENWMTAYKAVDGIMYAHQTRSKVQGMIITMHVQSIEHNIELPDGRFTIPDSVMAILENPTGD